MDYRKEGILGRIRTITSTLYGLILLWVARSLQSGARLLIVSTGQKLSHGACYIVNFLKIKSSPSPPTPRPSVSSSSRAFFELMPDPLVTRDISDIMSELIGADSGAFMGSFEEILSQQRERKQYKRRPTKLANRRERLKREFPPPLPSLAQTENLWGRMPCKFARHYSDGRLILREERIVHYEYLETSRENGRRILDLVSLDNTAPCCHIADVEHEDVKLTKEEDGEDTETNAAQVDDSLVKNGDKDDIDTSMAEPDPTLISVPDPIEISADSDAATSSLLPTAAA